jgi:succinate-semialdehyde dehydrogenase / glutarate-semialdehyde dehydrogenase
LRPAQRRPDLHLRQPDTGAGRRLRLVHQAAGQNRRKVAAGFGLGAVIGPLTDMKPVEKVEAHIADVVITKEETSGPVAPLYRFRTDDEKANDTEFGLAAYFYCHDIGRT